MSAPEDIISDEEIIRVHGYANFGDMSPREVVNDGVRKYAIGFTGGHTQLCILLEHKLITKPKPGKYAANLTQKGKRYARAVWNTRTPAPDVSGLLEALREANKHLAWAAGLIELDSARDKAFAWVYEADAELAKWEGR